MADDTPRPRIAVIQHGDFQAASRKVENGQAESYFGRYHSLQSLAMLLAGRPHLIISLDAPPGIERDGEDGVYVGCPRTTSRAPATLTSWAWAGKWVRHLAAFRPTHLLLRAGGVPAVRVLRWAGRHDVQVLAVFHGYFPRQRLYDRMVSGRLAALLNRPNVSRVGNHRRPAANSMIAAGVDANKVAAFDWPGRRHPRDYPARRLTPGKRPEILYAGSVDRRKGVLDLAEAVRRLHDRGLPATLTVAGTGPDLSALEQAGLPDGSLTRLGQVSNDAVFARMRAADVICVPSRREFTEGFPKTLTEGLASRTPVVVSDHPVFVEALEGTAGVRWFRGGDAASLSDAIHELLTTPELYYKTSEAAIEAYNRDDSPYQFGDLLGEWSQAMPDRQKTPLVGSA